MKQAELIFGIILVPLDFLMIVAAALAAYFLRYAEFIQRMRPVVFDLAFQEYLTVAILAGFLWLFIFAIFGLYTMRAYRRLLDEIGRIVLAVTVGMAVAIIIFFVQRELFASRFIILSVWGLAIIFISLMRIIIRTIQHWLFKKGIGNYRTVIIGRDETTKEISEELSRQPRWGFQIIKQITELRAGVSDIIKQLEKLIASRHIDAVIVADPNISKELKLAVLEFCYENHLMFRYAADLFQAQTINIAVQPIAGVPVIEIKRTPLDGWGRVTKRIFDIIGSVVLIIITAPIMILAAIAIKLDSRGPVLFSRLDDGSPTRRIGEKGEPFRYFKFRSMKTGTHHLRYTDLSKYDTRKGTPLVKIKDDPRITRVGRFLRKWSLDELPELFLVLGGKMSLAGPRPHLPEEVAKYEARHRKVHSIKPGMTGLAQISGRSELGFEEEVRLDNYYIENWSLWLDLQILLKTPWVVFFQPAV